MRPSGEEAAGALHSVTLILYGTYHPHRTAHEGPLQSIVSMGAHHPIPHGWLYQRDQYPPMDLLQWIYQMERDRTVRAADITIQLREKTWKTRGDRMVNSSLNKPLTSSMAFKLRHTDVAQLSSQRKRPAAKRELLETKTIRSNAYGETRSLPSRAVQDTGMPQVPQSDLLNQTDNGSVSRKAREAEGKRKEY